jgi:DNA repair protein RadA/Sms
MAKSATIYLCQSCGAKSPKWQGKCPECGSWNSLVETIESRGKKSAGLRVSDGIPSGVAPLFQALEKNSHHTERRFSSGFTEVDRVLGGGFLPGSILLFGGEPGIGKSTLMIQVLSATAEQKLKCLYVSGEESSYQVAARARRLNLPPSTELNFLATSSLDEVMMSLESTKPAFVVVDSVQTLASQELESAAGTVSQVREVTQKLLEFAKTTHAVILLIGHVTKEGTVAGPRLLEHMVDGVFYFESSTAGAYRLLRGQKNRFGATNELAVMEMLGIGLRQIENPSERFLMERAKDSPGSAIVAHLEGSRSFLTEVQALTQKCYQGYPRRTVQGLDSNRVAVLLAVMERSLGVSLAEHDVYCKVANGARIDEPAADLALTFALYSAAKREALPPDILFAGEVGLGGEIRSVAAITARLKEAKSVGVRYAVIPKWNAAEARDVQGVKLFGVTSLGEARKALEDTLDQRVGASGPRPQKRERSEELPF